MSYLISSSKTSVQRQRPDVLPRERLASDIASAIGSARLLLLCAPAGFGKTATLAQAVDRPGAVDVLAWINLDEIDDLQRFFAALIESVEAADLPWRASPEALLQRAEDPSAARELATDFAQLLARTDVARGLIALDDVHRIGHDAVFTFLSALLDALPANWSVAMTAREPPPLPLSRLRVAGDLREWREAELRFTEAEVAQLIGADAAGDARVRDMLARTQGWPVGVMMERMALAGGARPASSQAYRRHVFDYFAQEVFDRLPAGLQAFLLRCSVLPVMSTARCADVSGDVRAAQWLLEVEHRDLFVTLLEGDEPAWRLHDLFREFLQGQLLRTQADALPELLRRAARHEPDASLRIEFLLRAGDTDAAIGELLAIALPLIQAGAAEQLERLAQRLPPGVAAQSPDVAFVRALSGWHRWEYTSVARLMQAAWTGFERQGRLQFALKARALAAMALLHTGREGEALRILDAAVPVEQDATTALVWDICAVARSANVGPQEATGPHLARIASTLESSPQARDWVSVIHTLYPYTGRPGVMLPMARLLDVMATLGGEDRPWLRGGVTTALKAWLALWQADLAHARTLAAEAEADAVWAGQPASLVVPMQLLHAMDCQLTGRTELMLSTLDGMSRVAARSHERRSAVLFQCMAATFLAADQAAERARPLCEDVLRQASAYDWSYLAVASQALRCDLLLLDGEPARAVEAYRQFGPRAADCDWWGLHAHVCVSWARAELRAGHVAEAWRALSPALRHAADTGQVLGLLLCGPAALAELAGTAWGALAEPQALACLARCARRAAELLRPADTAPEAAPGGPADEPADASPGARPAGSLSLSLMSEREMEVLQFIADGLSNKHIARKLDLSPHTVKRHVARILAKTDCASRVQAAAWLRARQP